MDEYDVNIIALQEMREYLKRTFEAGDLLDQKANMVLSVISMFLPIATILELSINNNRCHSFLYWYIIALAIFLYIILIVASIIIINPRSYQTPLMADKNIIEKEILIKEDATAILSLIAGHIKAIEHNTEINNKKICTVRMSMIFLPIIVILIISLSIIS